MEQLEKKLTRAKALLDILVRIKDKNMIPCDRYYYVLKIFQQTRNGYEASRVPNPVVVSINKKCYFDAPELKVTSSTHERWKKKFNKDFDLRFKRF